MWKDEKLMVQDDKTLTCRSSDSAFGQFEFEFGAGCAPLAALDTSTAKER